MRSYCRPWISSVVSLAAALVLAAQCASSVAAETILIQGSTTFNTRLLVPYGADIERLAGVTLDVIPTKSAYGLIALIEGRVPLAMISGPLEHELPQLRARTAHARLADLQSFEIARTGVAFVAHPDNPVRSIAITQLADIFEGRLTSWRQLAGPDLPIRLVFVREGGVISSAQAHVIAGRPLQAPHALPVETPRHVLKVVMQEPGALAIAQSALVAQMALVPLMTDEPVAQVLTIVSQGNPNVAAARVIGAMQRVATERLR